MDYLSGNTIYNQEKHSRQLYTVFQRFYLIKQETLMINASFELLTLLRNNDEIA